MDLMTNEDCTIGTTIKWAGLFILLTLCAINVNSLHQQQLLKLKHNSELLGQKSFLVSKMHDEMLSISRIQLQLLQASSEQQVRSNLLQLSELISGHLIHYYQLKNIADESDAEILAKFKIGFEKWHDFNESLLAYANIVADAGFINTLNKVDLAISQLDEDSDKALLLISQIQKSDNNIN
jgi:hypothetical protein